MKPLLGDRLIFDWRVVTVTVISTLLLIVDAYLPAHDLEDLRSPDLVSAHPTSGGPARLPVASGRLRIWIG